MCVRGRHPVLAPKPIYPLAPQSGNWWWLRLRLGLGLGTWNLKKNELRNWRLWSPKSEISHGTLSIRSDRLPRHWMPQWLSGFNWLFYIFCLEDLFWFTNRLDPSDHIGYSRPSESPPTSAPCEPIFVPIIDPGLTLIIIASRLWLPFLPFILAGHAWNSTRNV